MIEKIKQALIDSDMSPRDLRIALDIITDIQIKELQKDIDELNKRRCCYENTSSRQ